MKSAGSNKNSRSIKKVEEMIALYNPQVMVLEDTAAKGSRRSPRIKALAKRLVSVAGICNIEVKLFSQKQVHRVFFGDADGKKTPWLK